MNIKSNKKKGFTLLEIVIVMAIIGAISAVVIPNVINSTNKSNKQAISSDKSLLSTRMEAFNDKNGYFAVLSEKITVYKSDDIDEFMTNLKAVLEASNIKAYTTNPDEYIADRFKVIDKPLLKSKDYISKLSNEKVTYIYDINTGEVLCAKDDKISIDEAIQNPFKPGEVVINKVVYEIGAKKMTKQNSSVEIGNYIIAGGEGDLKIVKVSTNKDGSPKVEDLTNLLPNNIIKVTLVQDVNGKALVEFINTDNTSDTKLIDIG